MTTYRARIEEGLRCRFHKLAQATETCSRCGASICDVCATFAGSHVACPGCADSIGRARKLQRAAIVAGLLATFAAAAFGLSKVTFAQQEAASAADKEEAELDDAGGCNEDRLMVLLQNLHDARRYNRELTRIDAYRAKGCPPFSRLLWQRRAALDADGQHDSAVRAATELIDDAPDSKDYWWWRAESWEKLGRLEEAAADYEQSIALEPQTLDLPERLARVYEKLGRPCDGIVPLVQFLHYHESPSTSDISAWASKLATSEACKPYAVRGTELFAFPNDPTERSAARTQVRIDGKAPGTFEADTRQSVSLVSRGFAERAGLPADGPRRRVHTPLGVQEATMATAGLVAAGAAEAPRVQLAMVDMLPEGVDGILGLSFLLRFRIVPTLSGLRVAPPPMGLP